MSPFKEDKRYGSLEQNKIKDSIKDFVSKVELSGNDRVYDFEKLSSLPIFILQKNFKDEKGAPFKTVALFLWKSYVLDSLPYSEFSESMVLSDGKLIFKRSEQKSLEGFLTNDAGFKQKITNNTKLGSGIKQYEMGSKFFSLYAFAKDAKTGLSFLTRTNPERNYQIINTILIQTAIWAWFFFLGALLLTYFASTSVTSKIKEVVNATQSIASGNFDTRILVRSTDETGHLSSAINSMAGKIEGLLGTQVEAARREKELETAKLVQNTFLPKNSYSNKYVDIYSYTKSASECGGDWYHFEQLGDYFYLVICDATGHGAGAALVTAMAYSSWTSLLKQDFNEAPKPSDIASHMNKIFAAPQGKSVSMTAVVLRYNMTSGETLVCGAGHNFPYSVSKEGKIKTIACAGSPLGLDEKAEYQNHEISLDGNEKVFLYTDGLIENTNAEGKVYPKKKVLNYIKSHFKDSPQEIAEFLIKDSDAHFGEHEADDDLSIVVFERKKALLNSSANKKVA